jgi:hypothetical protein
MMVNVFFNRPKHLYLALGLSHKYYTRMVKLVRDKLYSVFGLFISDEEKCFKTLTLL